MNKLLFFLVIIWLFSVNAFSATQKFVPDNNLYIPADQKYLQGISKESFDKIIDKVEAVYTPIFDSMYGKLQIERNWEDGTVNAYASRPGWNIYNVSMFGGLARYADMTEDAFALIICHELGHHLGGAPKFQSYFSKWASIEGQADYYSVLKCMRKVFKYDDNIAHIQQYKDIPEIVTNTCSQSFQKETDIALCIRSAKAGLAVGEFLAKLSNEKMPTYETYDPQVVEVTKTTHPNAQCRLDTFFSAAVCNVSDDINLSNTNVLTGACNESFGYTTRTGARPHCWFKP